MNYNYLGANDLSFGKRLKILIANHTINGKKCTQEVFAEKTGISLATLKQYMKDNTKPDYEIFLRMAHILQVDPEYLACNTNSPFMCPSSNNLYSLLHKLGYYAFSDPKNEDRVYLKKNDLEIYIDDFKELENKVDEFLLFQMYQYSKK